MRRNKVKRPWGCYIILSKGAGFKVKLVRVLPQGKLSLQKHKFRSEHWVVVQGKAKITNGENILVLAENESTYIPRQKMHRLENLLKDKPLTIIEVQCGQFLKESDIERLDDAYQRHNKSRNFNTSFRKLSAIC